TGIGPDQLRGHAHATARFAHAALDDVAHAELLPDFLDVDRLALISKGRVTRDHRKGPPAGQHRDDVFSDAVSEIFLLRVTTELGHRNTRRRATIFESGRTGRNAPPVCKRRPLPRDLTAEPEDADRSGDILQVVRAKVLEIEPNPPGDPIANDFRDVDAT